MYAITTTGLGKNNQEELMKNLAVLTGAMLLLGCAGINAGSDSGKKSIDPSVQKAIDNAVAANKQAASIGYEWRDAEELIDDAKKAAEAGDNDKALSLANEARSEGDLAYEQGLSQKNAGPRF
jgi:hypothetical protein